MGSAAHLTLFITVQLVSDVKGSQPCSEAHASRTSQCEPIPEDSAAAGAALLQSNKVTALLGESQPAAAAPPVEQLVQGDRGGSTVSREGALGLPSLALIQEFSSGSGIQTFSASEAHRPSRRQTPGMPSSMMNIVGQGGSSLKVESRFQSTFFYLVPMGVSLSASFLLLSLVYCVTRGERAEDEHISRVLVGLGSAQAQPKLQQVHAQRPQPKLPEAPKEPPKEPTRPSVSANAGNSASSASTAAPSPQKPQQEEDVEKQESEAPTSGDEGADTEASIAEDDKEAEATSA